ncbi:MAG: hypothetical protein AB7S92_25340 [Parvibaculaceae bacterium]
MSRPADPEGTLEDLDRDILDAHSRADGRRLARLYSRAAERFTASKDHDRSAFLYVNAYVWALEAGETDLASNAHRILVQMDREE